MGDRLGILGAVGHPFLDILLVELKGPKRLPRVRLELTAFRL